MAPDATASEPHGYYQRLDGGRFAATYATQSPWDPSLQHGGPPTALLARAMLTAHPRNDLRLARITADFLGPIPLGTVEVATRVVRPGKRIELLEATMSGNGREVVVARAWRIAVSPAGTVPPGVTAPDAAPARAPAQEPPHWLRGFGYGQSIEWRYSEPVRIGGPTAVWARPRIPLLEGEPAEPLDRALIVVDSANGVSAELPMTEWLFVPPSLTVALERYPRGEWVLLEARSTLTDDGLGACVARLADDDGYYGHGLQSLFVQRHAQ